MLFMMIMMKFADTILGMFNLLECQNLYVFFFAMRLYVVDLIDEVITNHTGAGFGCGTPN